MPDRITLRGIPKFDKWLRQRGAEILQPTNKWEVLRFRCAKGVGVVYKNASGAASLGQEWIKQAWLAYKRNLVWDGFEKRPKRCKKMSRMKKQLTSRDGHECFYCGKEFGTDDLTVEHLLSVVHQGPNRMENLVLACQPCNEVADNLTVKQKVELRDELRGNA